MDTADKRGQGPGIGAPDRSLRVWHTFQDSDVFTEASGQAGVKWGCGWNKIALGDV